MIEKIIQVIDLFGERFRLGARQNHHLGIRGHFRLARQIQRFDLETFLLQSLLDVRVSAALAVREVLLAMSLNEVDGLGFSPLHFDDGVGEILFLHFLGSLFDFLQAPAVQHHHGAELEGRAGKRIRVGPVGRDPILLGDIRMFVGIDKFVAEVAADSPVLVQELFQRRIVASRKERLDFEIVVQLAQKLFGLGSQAVAPGAGQVKPLGMSLPEKVEPGNQAEVLCRPLAEGEQDLLVVGDQSRDNRQHAQKSQPHPISIPDTVDGIVEGG